MHVLLYCVHCIFVYGWSFPQVALWLYPKLYFSSLGKKIFSILFNLQKFLYWLSFFFGLHFLGGVIFCLFVLFVFCNAASPKACWELSAHYASCFVGTFFMVSQKVGGQGGMSVHGLVIKCLLYFSEFWYQHCKAYCLFQTSFWLWYS